MFMRKHLSSLTFGISALILTGVVAFAQNFVSQIVPQGNYNLSARTAADMALPAPYARDETFFKLPSGRTLGSVSGVAIDRDGKSIWVIERCGTQFGCIGSSANPILKFDSHGNLIRQFGAGMLVYPHGLFVDRDGNVWVADASANFHRPFIFGQPDKRMPDAPKGTKPAGAVVLKFSPDGKLLMTLGTPGVSGSDATHLSTPTNVLVAPNGDIFVADGHDTQPSNARIVKFDKAGKFLKAWNTCGKKPINTLDCEHALAMDSQGRLFVANRGNNKISIFDQDGSPLGEWTQFGKPSGLFIDRNDTLYSADSESDVTQGNAFIRGVHIGSARTGKVTAFLPDPHQNPSPWMPGPPPSGVPSGSESVTAGADGTLYVGQVLPAMIVRYVPKK
jgi:sugar lactone lactonase YvrE